MGCKTVRMSRSAKGKSSGGFDVCHGSDGARGMGSQYSGRSGKVPPLARTKVGKASKTRAWGKQPDPIDVFLRGFGNL